MGFLGFLKKKKEDSIGNQLELPPLPPKGGEAELPSFTEQESVEDLRLPEIPELEQASSENQELPEFPAQQEVEQPALGGFEMAPEPPAPPQPEIRRPEPPVPMQEEQEHESMEEAYKYTPAEPRIEEKQTDFTVPEFPKKETQIEGFRTGSKGDVFIRGDDYRNLLESLEMFIRKEREKNTKKERDIFRVEEREYERFMKIVEDLQRSLIVTENNIFE